MRCDVDGVECRILLRLSWLILDLMSRCGHNVQVCCVLKNDLPTVDGLCSLLSCLLHYFY